MKNALHKNVKKNFRQKLLVLHAYTIENKMPKFHMLFKISCNTKIQSWQEQGHVANNDQLFQESIIKLHGISEPWNEAGPNSFCIVLLCCVFSATVLT